MPRLLRLLLPTTIMAFVLSVPCTAQTLDQTIKQSFETGELPGLHGVIINWRSERLAEQYFSGEDEIWGRPLGMRDHGPDTLHDLRSVTKSIVGLIYGIALSEGKVPPLDAPLYAQFPQYADLADQPGRDLILVGHVFSMQMGLEWNEDLPYTDPRNSEIAMERAEDRYRYVLEQPVVEPPGENWTYSGGAVALIGKLIAGGTGMSLEDYAKEALFNPLGIAQFEWVSGDDGIASAASGLRLTLPDLAKIGQMIADDGAYEGQQIVPADWLTQSFRSRVKISEFAEYGALWYLAGTPEDMVVIAVGNGGQRLTVQPTRDLVVVSYSGQYNNPDSWKTSFKLVSEFAVPAAQKLLAK